MDIRTFTRKLTSRKFWLAVCSFVTLIAIARGKTQSEAAQISAIIMAGASILAYIIGEGLVDASRTEQGTEDEDEEEA